jgi:hypothetical protein
MKKYIKKIQINKARQKQEKKAFENLLKQIQSDGEILKTTIKNNRYGISWNS